VQPDGPLAALSRLCTVLHKQNLPMQLLLACAVARHPATRACVNVRYNNAALQGTHHILRPLHLLVSMPPVGLNARPLHLLVSMPILMLNKTWWLQVNKALTYYAYEDVAPAAVLDSRKVAGETQYLVAWRDDAEDSWVPAEHVSEEVRNETPKTCNIMWL
jgi:hypothetical protein